MASKIMVIRHAEKPDDPPPVFGVAEDGSQSPNELSVRGWQRAGALVRLFAPVAGPCRDPRLATPDRIFASSALRNDHSLRPQHTVVPLAAQLGREVDITHPATEEPALVAAAKTAPGVVLIAWHHEHIPAIGGLILGDDTICPTPWDKKRFDLVWVFDQTAAGTWHFDQVPQLLLAGDRADTM